MRIDTTRLGWAGFLLALSLSLPVEDDLSTAIRAGDLERVRALVTEAPARVAATDADGKTPLHIAAEEAQLEIARWLIEQGSDIEAADNMGNRSLHACQYGGSRELLRLLIKEGAEIDSINARQRTPLMLLVNPSRFDLDNALYLIDHDARLDQREQFGSYVLESAALHGFNELIEALLSAGARMPSSPMEQRELLRSAALGGAPLVFLELVESVPTGGNAGASYLMSAAAGGSPEIGAALLDGGVSADPTSDEGMAPIHLAAEAGHREFVELLLDGGATIDRRNGLGQTAYNLADAHGYGDIMDSIRERGGSTAPQAFPRLEGEYFGQTPPGDELEVFAPEIISVASRLESLHSSPVFTPNGAEMLWTQEFLGPILASQRSDGRWSAPRPVSFLSEQGDGEPVFSSDGGRVFYLSRRPLPGRGATEKENIWFVERTAEGWSAPRPAPGKVNDYNTHWQFCLDGEDAIYVPSNREGGAGGKDIYRSRLVDGTYAEPELLGRAINSEVDDAMPFVSADGNTLVFTRRFAADGHGGFDVYVSRRDQDGAWGRAVNAGPAVNGPGNEICPVLSPDGKYLFVLRGNMALWISASVLPE